MAKTSHEAFRIFNQNLIPSDAEREKAKSHRQTIYDKLEATYGIYTMFQSGSFAHGTGISGHSDVDYFIVLKPDAPQSSDSILTSVRTTMLSRFTTTTIHVSRPAVVLEFGQGYERVELIPAYPAALVGDGKEIKYKIPSVVPGEWMESTPKEHLKYVNQSDVTVADGSTKKLIRLAKAWKYYNNVPISSFYLEIRAAAYMRTQKDYIPWLDIYYYLKQLHTNQLSAMNDPTGNTGRIFACSTTPKAADALSKLDSAMKRAENGKDYLQNGYTQRAFDEWDKLFNGRFPSFY